jgi:hypothetical protein
LIHEKTGGLTVPAGGMLSLDTDEFLSLHNKLNGMPAAKSSRA